MTKAQQLYQNKPKKPKTKRCKVKVCRKPFVPLFPFQEWCSDECALLLIEQKKQEKINKIKKQHNREKKEFRESDRSYLTKQAQDVFNRYIRLRDKNLPCISCGHTGNRQRHASHYRSVGGHSQHRFNEDNCHSACSICNSQLSGNLVPYRVALIKKIGIEKVIALEEDNTVKKYSIDDLKIIIKKYINLNKTML